MIPLSPLSTVCDVFSKNYISSYGRQGLEQSIYAFCSSIVSSYNIVKSIDLGTQFINKKEHIGFIFKNGVYFIKYNNFTVSYVLSFLIL